MEFKLTILKRMVRPAFWLLLVFVVGGLGGLYFNRYVLPEIRDNRTLSKVNFLRRLADNVTIINKIEQVTIKEDDSVNEIANRAAVAVVNIISKSETLKTNQAGRNLPVTAQVGSSSGTGVIVTSDGLVATYRSAIKEQAATYKIFTNNGVGHDARLVGVDEFSNLAFLKMETGNLSDMPFANSDEFKPGRKLIAIGNYSGEYQNRYSAGLLSNLNKTFNLAGKVVASSEKLEGVLETDFNQKREYLGGPVISYRGEMVGIIGETEIDNQTYFFQVPANQVRQAIERVIANRSDKLPTLGAYYISITKEYAFAHDLSLDRGALIFAPSGKQSLALIAGSPAEKAGLQIGDVITMVGNKGVNLDNPLSNLLSAYQKGDQIELTVVRGGQESKLRVQL